MAVQRPGEMAERGELTLKDAAARLGTSKTTVLRLIANGMIDAAQVCKGAPWAIPKARIDALKGTNFRHAGPRTRDPKQKKFDFSAT